jgi:hypothetical protein
MNYILAKSLEFLTAIPGLISLLLAGVIISLVFLTLKGIKGFFS